MSFDLGIYGAYEPVRAIWRLEKSSLFRIANKNDANIIYRNFTIRQFKNIMQEVVDEGSKFDDTIDNNLNFETIRRVNKNGIIYYT